MIYRGANDIVAYEVDGMPPRTKASIVSTDGGEWQILGTLADASKPPSARFKTADAAFRALQETMAKRSQAETDPLLGRE